jgi:hypothetical protein
MEMMKKPDEMMKKKAMKPFMSRFSKNKKPMMELKGKDSTFHKLAHGK